MSKTMNCPTCELSGVTPERARELAPRYMSAIDTLPPMAVPDEPADECWDCRCLRAAGYDPEALV